MFTLPFWKATVERTIRTAAATLAGFVTVDVSAVDVDWGQAFGVSGAASIATVLLSLAGGLTSGEGPGVTESVKPRDEPL